MKDGEEGGGGGDHIVSNGTWNILSRIPNHSSGSILNVFTYVTKAPCFLTDLSREHVTS